MLCQYDVHKCARQLARGISFFLSEKKSSNPILSIIQMLDEYFSFEHLYKHISMKNCWQNYWVLNI